MKRNNLLCCGALTLGGALSFSLLTFGGCSFARTGSDTPLYGIEVRETETELSPGARRAYAYLVYSRALAGEDEAGLLRAAHLLRDAGAPPQVWLEGAVWLMTRGTPAVLPFAQEAVNACGDNASLNLIYAEALAANGLNEKALQLMRDYLQRHPDAMDARLELVLLLVKGSHFEEAERMLLAITGKERTPMVDYYHARALIGMRRNDEAIDYLRAAIRENPTFTEAMLELAYLYERQSAYDKARSLYERLLRRNVSPDKIVLRLISLSLRMKQPEKALGYMKYGPDNDAFRITAAGLFMEERHYLQAEGLLKQVAASGKATADVYLLLADLSFEQRRNLAQACLWLDRVPEEQGDRALLLRAQLYAQDNQWDKALAFLRQGIAAYPAKPVFGLMEIRMLYSREKKEEAWAAAAQAMKRWPTDEEIAFIYASMLDEQGKKQDALAVMEQIILDHPKSHAALNYIGYTLAEQGRDLDRALELLRRADALDPGQAYIMDSLAWAYFKKGDIDEALKQIRRAVSSAGGDTIDPAIWEHYGDIAARAGFSDEARKAYTNAIAGKPANMSAIKEKLSRLSFHPRQSPPPDGAASGG